MLLGLVKMNFGLVHASYSLPEWQAVKLTFFAPFAPVRSIRAMQYYKVEMQVRGPFKYMCMYINLTCKKMKKSSLK